MVSVPVTGSDDQKCWLTAVIQLFSWLVLKAAWGLSADEKKGKKLSNWGSFSIGLFLISESRNWLSMYLNIFWTILQSHYLGQENTIQFLSRKSRNVRTNSLCLRIYGEWEEHHLKSHPVGRIWGINSQVFLLRKLSEDFFVVMSWMK